MTSKGRSCLIKGAAVKEFEVKRLRILLSAYACRSDVGSEPAVGWNWAVELSRIGHDVTVITRNDNRQSINKGLLKANLTNLRFCYWDLPSWMQRFRKTTAGEHLYYRIWQLGAYRWLRSRMQDYPIDLVQHITYGTLRDPSFMGLLGVPFIFGPVGGGENTPISLRRSFQFRDRLFETVRGLSNRAIRFDPLLRLTFASAQLIAVTTSDSKELLPRKYQRKAVVQQAIGTSALQAIVGNTPKSGNRRIRVLFVARLIHWKAGHLAIRAVAQAMRAHPNMTLTIRGDGPESDRLHSLAKELGIASSVDWVGKLSPDCLLQMYSEHDVFLFPSLHDSGGLAVLEAMTHGLPVVCLDLGGPGTIVNENSGRVISTRDVDESTVVDRLASAISELASSPALLVRLQAGASKEAQRYSWNRIVTQLYSTLASDQDSGS
jgi:glycosyltransferase involved in cell wall biosynthesis